MAFQRLLCCWHGGLFVWSFFWAFCTGKPLFCLKLTDSDGFCMRVSPFTEEILGKTERKSEKTFQTRFQSSMYTRTLFFIKNVLC
ncbi:hypothetical protein FAEPRAA2165_00040 [Faecalibacterium duncaniae]|uniref:Uncharacterized protein n=1 Tax=Faecalibacterium duncaniae (strain DSM 17677 / JCM 31915 / A2-165) TaxID=411483 RepID=C7H1A2_FAED2|nr:hypothetical protein FAEPRAA2165_00040 [Faecalibacterium duncaniae]